MWEVGRTKRLVGGEVVMETLVVVVVLAGEAAAVHWGMVDVQVLACQMR